MKRLQFPLLNYKYLTDPQAAKFKEYRDKNKQKINENLRKRRRMKRLAKQQQQQQQQNFLKNLKCKMDQLYEALEGIRSTAHYRFQMEWSFHLGYSTNTIRTYGFETPHNIETPPYNSLGRCLTHPLNKPSHPPWHKTLFVLATELFKFIIPDYVQKQYMIHFSKMSADDHNVPLHVDCHDIGPQYLLLLGDWEGAELKSYNCTDDKKVGKDRSLFPSFSFSTPKQILKLDGRLAHEVIQTNFSGVRYTVIAYQLWHEDKTKPEPLFYPPVPIHPPFSKQ